MAERRKRSGLAAMPSPVFFGKIVPRGTIENRK